ncbi:MAG: DUF1153 domain-containing protein [Alphaproteobacteria bacterium]|nr:MAG: DUF1153 domain-containing protein [Alphaproteobacteria bacterium]
MFSREGKGPESVELPDGKILRRTDLPPPDTRRWVASRKAIVARAVLHGLLSEVEACRLYALSEEELQSWIRALVRHGDSALKVTRLQKYRQL